MLRLVRSAFPLRLAFLFPTSVKRVVLLVQFVSQMLDRTTPSNLLFIRSYFSCEALLLTLYHPDIQRGS